MKIVISSDFSGFNLKQAVKKYLSDNKHEVDDVGQVGSENKVLYFDAAISLATAMQTGVRHRNL